MNINNSVGSRIKKYRTAIGKPQKEMAAELKIPVSTYANYEAGRRKLTFEKLVEISSILNFPFEFFLQDDYENPIEWKQHQRDLRTVMERGNPSEIETFFNMPEGSIADKIYTGFEGEIQMYMEQLNNIGKKEAVKRVEELTHIDKYTEAEDTKMPKPLKFNAIAAHERTDIEVTDEMRAADDAIMDDDDF